MHLWCWKVGGKKPSEHTYMFPKHYPKCYFFYFREGEQTTGLAQSPLADKSQPGKQTIDPHTIWLLLPSHILSMACYSQYRSLHPEGCKKETLLKRGSIQRENAAKKLWIFSHAPQSPFQYSTHQDYMSICKTFPSLGCCTDWHAESRVWEEHRSTCISKVHFWAVAFSFVWFYVQALFFVNKVWSNSGSIYNAVSYSRRIENLT